MLDNLIMHKTKLIKEFCSENEIELNYNSIYTSETNPIERAWALAK
jgi:transposase